MTGAHELFEADGMWDADAWERQSPRYHDVEVNIPDDVRSLLDVGCGNGAFLKILNRSARPFDSLHGSDFSARALESVETPSTLAPINDLPFADQAFDAATCLEVIEHLPVSIYEAGLKELCRVARKYVLITVPNDEDIGGYYCACNQCHCRFNPNYHVRGFNRQKMETLLDEFGFRNTKVFLSGPFRYYYGITPLYGRGRGDLTTKLRVPVPCPTCGSMVGGRSTISSDLAPAEDAASSKSGGWKSLFPHRTDHAWIGGVYARD